MTYFDDLKAQLDDLGIELHPNEMAYLAYCNANETRWSPAEEDMQEWGPCCIWPKRCKNDSTRPRDLIEFRSTWRDDWRATGHGGISTKTSIGGAIKQLCFEGKGLPFRLQD